MVWRDLEDLFKGRAGLSRTALTLIGLADVQELRDGHVLELLLQAEFRHAHAHIRVLGVDLGNLAQQRQRVHGFSGFQEKLGAGQVVGNGVVHQATDDIQVAKQRVNLRDRKSTRLNSSHSQISYAVFCLKKKK